ncbi:hypothetical protein [Pollutibacter soli]|uniref:hypothetical protein n=1 Tax=Pollutibacter soli TaxID=3034157 RepID=UPI003013A245
MRIIKSAFLICFVSVAANCTQAQIIQFEGKSFEAKNVIASVSKLDGKQVLKLERDLNAIPFDVNRLESTVDEPTYVKLKDLDFENGTIEVKMLSRIQDPSPFQFAQGFIGIAFRIAENDTAFESIYLRPRVGRSANQLARNRTVQYYSYPRFKFDTLRKTEPGMYETSAPVNIDEWIVFRLEVKGEKAELFINDAKYSTMIVSKMKGSTQHGSIGLWVDIGTTGYFKDLRIVKK